MAESTNPLTFDFLPVGQGDGILVSCPHGEKILVDLGSSEGWNSKTNGKDIVNHIISAIRSNNNKLDYLVLTHSDTDHYNKLPSLFERMEEESKRLNDESLHPKNAIRNIIVGGLVGDYRKKRDKKNYTWSDFGIRFRQEKDGLDLAYFEPPDMQEEKRRIQCKDVGIWILSANYPEDAARDLAAFLGRNRKEQSTREQSALEQTIKQRKTHLHSIVLLFKYGEKKVILTGDAGILARAHVLGTYAQYRDNEQNSNFLNCDVLKIAHHGEGFQGRARDIFDIWLQTTDPKYVVVSAGLGRKYDHPHFDTIRMCRRQMSTQEKPAEWDLHTIFACSELSKEKLPEGWQKSDDPEDPWVWTEIKETLFTTVDEVVYSEDDLTKTANLACWRLTVTPDRISAEKAEISGSDKWPIRLQI